MSSLVRSRGFTNRLKCVMLRNRTAGQSGQGSCSMAISYWGAFVSEGLCCGLSMITSASIFVIGLLNKVVARGSSDGLVVVVVKGAGVVRGSMLAVAKGC